MSPLIHRIKLFVVFYWETRTSKSDTADDDFLYIQILRGCQLRNQFEVLYSNNPSPMNCNEPCIEHVNYVPLANLCNSNIWISRENQSPFPVMKTGSLVRQEFYNNSAIIILIQILACEFLIIIQLKILYVEDVFNRV